MVALKFCSFGRYFDNHCRRSNNKSISYYVAVAALLQNFSVDMLVKLKASSTMVSSYRWDL